MDYSGLTFKDLTILQGFRPDPADPDMWGWWDGDQFVTDSQVVSVWGDASDNTVDRVVASGRNLLSTAPGNELFCSTTDSTENLCGTSANWHSSAFWTKSGFTSSSAKVGTFTAQNGYARFIVARRYYTPLANYTFTIKLKRNSGNTGLQLFGDATNQNITIDGTLKQYSMTFNAPASGDFYCGVRDTNAAGFGEIEFDEAHCHLTSGSSTYIATTSKVRPISRNNHRYIGVGSFGASSALTHGVIGAGNGIDSPCTIYWAGRFVPFVTGKTMLLIVKAGGAAYNLLCQTDGSGATARMRLYTAAGPNEIWTTTGWITDYTWYIFCAVVNGASSLLRINDGTTNRVFSGTLGAMDAGDGYFRWFGGDGWVGNSVSFDLLECVGYYSAHDISKQDRHIGYFRSKLGI